MATDGGDVRIGIVADTGDFEKDLKKVSDSLDRVADSAQGLGNDLDKQLSKGAEKASKKTKALTKQTKASTKGLDTFTDSAGDADSVLQGLAGALDMVSPELAGVTRLVGDAAGGVEALSKGALISGPVLGAAAAAIAALGAAYFMLRSDLDAAEAAMKTAADEATRASEVYKTFKSTIRDVSDEYGIMIGRLDEVEVKTAKAAENVRKQTRSQIDDQRLAIIETQKQLDLADERTKSQENRLMKDEAAIGRARDTEERLTKTLQRQQAVLGGLEQTRDNAIFQAEETIRLSAQEKKDTEEATAAAKALLKARADRLKVEREAEQLTKARLSAIDQLSKIEQAATVASLDGAERLNEQYRLELANLDKIKQAHADDAEILADAREAEAALAQRHAKDLADLRMAKAEEYAKFDEQQRKAELDRFRANSAAMVDASSDLAFAVEDATALILDNESAASADAALQIFRVNQAAAIANIGIRVAEGLATAASLPPPIDIAKAASVLAVGGVAVATVTSQQPPQFHSGGMAPDERDIRVTKNEGVLNSTAMGRIGGETGLNALNRGGGTTQTIVVQNKYTHRAFDTVVQDNLRRPGSPLRGAVKGSTKVGHKVRG